MIPQILHLGPIPVNSFGLCVALAILIGIYRLEISFKINQINPKLAEKYALAAGLFGLLGARILYLINNYNEIKSDFWSSAFSGAGFVFFGGFILSTIVLISMSRFDKISLPKFLDSLGPALTLAYLIGRLGCQLSGDGDYGIATATIFGMPYDTGVVPTPAGVKVFPTPFYESTICAFILLFLTKLENNSKFHKPYFRFGAYLALISVERFLIEFLRINPKIYLGLSEAQIISILILIVASTLLFKPSETRS